VAKDLSDMSGILFRLIEQRKPLALKAMLDAGADVFMRNKSGSTLLIEAAKASDIDSLHILISFGGAKLINHPDYESNTALHYTVANDDGITASFLRANGADEGLQNMYGLTPAEGLTLHKGGYGEQLNF
jgi:ankyrin repeat protein